MKKSLLVLIFPILSLAQKNTPLLFSGYVECCYLQKISESIVIYDEPNGYIVKKLAPLSDRNCWYKFAISKSKDSWLKIENIIVLPGCGDNEINKDFYAYKGRWVHSKNMMTALPDSQPESGKEYHFYLEPNKDSKIVITLNSYKDLNLIGVNENWAKVRFDHEKKQYIGWLEHKYQCPYLWTTCPIYD